MYILEYLLLYSFIIEIWAKREKEKNKKTRANKSIKKNLPKTNNSKLSMQSKTNPQIRTKSKYFNQRKFNIVQVFLC